MSKRQIVALMAATLYHSLNSQDYGYAYIVNTAYALYDETVAQSEEQANK